MLGLKRKKSIVGIDFGSKTTKVAQLSFNGTDKPDLERCDLIQTGLLDEEFEGNIKAFLKENKITGAMVASSIDDASMKIRKLELPKMPDADLIEAIKWNLRDIVDGDVDDFTVNYSRIEEVEDGDVTRLKILAYAIKKQAVIDYRTKIESLGLSSFYIEPASVTLASTLERCQQNEEGYMAGVHIGSHQTLFYVVGNGIFVFSRPMIGINLEAWEKDKEGFFQKLAIEIQKSIDTFKVNFKMEDIRALHLSGGGALLEGIVDYLNTNLGISTNSLDPFITLSNVDVTDDVKPELFVQAIGLAYLQP
jgi:Tfp pilus assembly PilM family ATPase